MSSYFSTTGGTKAGCSPGASTGSFTAALSTGTTDLDTKNVKVFSDNPGEYVASFLLGLKNRNWMKQNAHSKRSRARMG